MKEELLLIIDKFKELHDFIEIIPLSALKGDNVDSLLGAILKYLPEGPMYYDADTITDQPERQIVAELIREKALRSLGERSSSWNSCYDWKNEGKKNRRIIDIDATIICERDSHKGIIIGKQGAKLKQIGTMAGKK